MIEIEKFVARCWQSSRLPLNLKRWVPRLFSIVAAIERRWSSATMPCRGVRGATTVEQNSREEILTATRQLLALMIHRNRIDKLDVASAIFTITPDLDAEFPALAARQLGWLDVPLLCTHEIAVPGSLPRCIRVLVHWNTDVAQHDIQHAYVRDAVRLRPDLSKLPPVDWEELEAWIDEQMQEHR